MIECAQGVAFKRLNDAYKPSVRGRKYNNVQQWLSEQALGIEPADADEKPKPRRSQADKWAMNHQTAAQCYEREGHLRVPRKHIETIMVGSRDDERDRENGTTQEEQEIKLGTWTSDQ